MKVIGLTGGIASGKSTASAYLRALGAPVVDADAISRASTKRGGAAFDAVVSRFGAGILLPDGEIDRRALGARVFADEGERRALNAIVHPVVIAECRQEIERCRALDAPACVLDVPLLFETGMDALCDETWLLYVSRQEQIRRLAQRDGLDAAAAAARIDSQMPLAEKLRRADRAIDASGTIEETREKVRRLWEELL